MPDSLQGHFVALLPGIASGRVVPLFGAGVPLSARPEGEHWSAESSRLPSGRELFHYLAAKFEYPTPEDGDLATLAQYVTIVAGRGTLYDELRNVFDADYPPTIVHRLFAELPALLEQQGLPGRHQLIVTTNYDDLMERAFQEAGEAYDVVWYVADGPDRGKFMHRLYQGEVRLIEKLAEYRDINLERRSLVLKLHGTVDRFDRDRDSYVMTIDDYLEYLIRADITALLPPDLVAKLYRSHFLFMGYGLRDWNLQVILHRIWGEQRLATKSWAVMLYPDEVSKILWDRRNVEILDHNLQAYAEKLRDRLAALNT